MPKIQKVVKIQYLHKYNPQYNQFMLMNPFKYSYEQGCISYHVMKITLLQSFHKFLIDAKVIFKIVELQACVGLIKCFHLVTSIRNEQEH